MRPLAGKIALMTGGARMIALKRYGRPQEIAALVAFLAGPEGARGRWI